MHAGSFLYRNSYPSINSHTMNLRKTITLAAVALIGLSLAHAADIAGKWTADFESPIGVQKYVYEFKVDGDKITGKGHVR